MQSRIEVECEPQAPPRHLAAPIDLEDDWPIDDINRILEDTGQDCQFSKKNGMPSIMLTNQNKSRMITNFWIMPIKEHREHGWLGFESQLTMMVKSSFECHEVTISCDELSTPDWVFEKFGHNSGLYLSISGAKKIKEIVNVLCSYFYESIDVSNEYRFDGFSRDGSFYMKQGRKVTAQLFKDQCCDEKAHQEAQEDARFVDQTVLGCLEREKMLSLLAVRILSPFSTELCMKKGINLFTVNIVGQTGTGKTTLCKQLFRGDGKIDASIAELTDAAESDILMNCSDRVVVFDDAYPVTSRKKQQEYERRLELLCRTAGDVGARRITMKNVKSKCEPRCCIPAISAEMDITSNPSTLARMYTVRLARGEMNFEKLTMFKENLERNESFCAHCLFWGMGQTEFSDMLQTWFNEAKEYYREGLNYAHMRYVETASLIEVGARIYIQYMVTIGMYDSSRKETELSAIQIYLRDYVKAKEMDSSPQGTLYSIFRQWELLRSHGVATIAKYQKEGRKSIVSDNSANVVAYLSKDGMLFIRKNFMQVLVSKAEQNGMKIPDISMRRLHDILSDCKAISEYGRENAFTKQIQISGKRESLCCIRYSFYKYLLGGKDNEKSE